MCGLKASSFDAYSHNERAKQEKAKIANGTYDVDLQYLGMHKDLDYIGYENCDFISQEKDSWTFWNENFGNSKFHGMSPSNQTYFLQVYTLCL